MTVPFCRLCGSDRDVIVHIFEDSTWAYYCTRCDRAIPWEDFKEGNP